MDIEGKIKDRKKIPIPHTRRNLEIEASLGGKIKKRKGY